jgi:mannose-6-phosphate isomerase-like protein (cupin superfamily)
MPSPTPAFHLALADALKLGPPPPGNAAVPVFSHGSLVVELYSPDRQDGQQPHGRDEIYFVARGKGLFFDGTRRQKVEAGAFLFVAAGQVHRFEAFSSDFTVWVVFYGPEGGEADR